MSVQVTLDVQRKGGVPTKGPRGGAFVMYNCARLHTLFDSYERGVEKGEGRDISVFVRPMAHDRNGCQHP